MIVKWTYGQVETFSYEAILQWNHLEQWNSSEGKPHELQHKAEVTVKLNHSELYSGKISTSAIPVELL